MRFDSMDSFSPSRIFEYTLYLEPLLLFSLTLPTTLTYMGHLLWQQQQAQAPTCP
jgi:hypothetical protein